MRAAGQKEGCSPPAGRIPPWLPAIPRKLPHRQIRKGLLLPWKTDTIELSLWGDPGLSGILFEGIFEIAILLAEFIFVSFAFFINSYRPFARARHSPEIPRTSPESKKPHPLSIFRNSDKL